MDPTDPNTAAPADESAIDAEMASQKEAKRPSSELAPWVIEKVNRWRQTRDANYDSAWRKYYRIFRGQWDESLKIKNAERSKIITPATQSAVDQTVAEMAEAVFGRGVWFDIYEEQDAAKAQAEAIRDALLDDFDNTRLKSDVIETFYNGAIYGTGISKRCICTKADGTKYVDWEPIPPQNFVIDSAATTVDEALGCAHETIRPKHEIKEAMESGEYFKEDISSATGFGASNMLRGSLNDILEIDPEDGVYITEYHGLVPKGMLAGKDMNDADDLDLLVDDYEKADADEDDDKKYVEAIVVIANGTTLLKGEANPLNDRGFIAYQHHRDPNSFYGIGVAEKAYNSQVGLDAEVRARIDTLGLTSYPIVGVDATRMPRNMNMTIAPGKVYMTNGRPSEIIEPIIFGNLNPASFTQSGDMERFVQVATGANDPAKALNANSTASGSSMATSSFIKRAKLTMQSVDTDYLSPLIRKSMVAYNYIDKARYPLIPTFVVNSTMSIMAREFEQMQMTNLLAVIPQESAAFSIVLKGIVENYSGPSKDKMLEAIDQMNKPDPAAQAAQQQQQQLTMAKLQGEVSKVQAEVKEIESRAGLNTAKGQAEMVKASHADQQLHLQAGQLAVSAKQADTQAKQVEISAAQVQVEHHHRTHDRNADLEKAKLQSEKSKAA